MKFRIFVITIAFISQSVQTQSQQSGSNKGLKDHFKDYFTIGVAVSPQSLKTDEAGLILSQFNSMTPENAMKMGPIHPYENQYNWLGGDSVAAFAKRNHLKLRGHCSAGITKRPAGFLLIPRRENK
jgi:endo-1,4-beta-xylanase